jgi:hypothetical protein
MSRFSWQQMALLGRIVGERQGLAVAAKVMDPSNDP